MIHQLHEALFVLLAFVGLGAFIRLAAGVLAANWTHPDDDDDA